MTGAALRIGLSRDLADVRRVAACVRQWAEPRLAEGMAGDFELAFVEAATNAVQHAPSEAGVALEVHLAEIDSELVLELVDGACSLPEHAFHDAQHAARALADGVGSVRGRGLLIISALMDRVDYRCSRGESRLVMAMLREPSRRG